MYYISAYYPYNVGFRIELSECNNLPVVCVKEFHPIHSYNAPKTFKCRVLEGALEYYLRGL